MGSMCVPVNLGVLKGGALVAVLWLLLLMMRRQTAIRCPCPSLRRWRHEYVLRVMVGL